MSGADEVARLKESREFWFQRARDVAKFKLENVRLRSLLQEAQWGHWDSHKQDEVHAACPMCDGEEDTGHTIKCPIAAVLNREPCKHEQWVTEVDPADGCEDSWVWWDCSNGIGPTGGPISAPIDKVFCVKCGITAAEVKDGRKES